jgi:ammonia channel protein AmtB
LSSNRALIVAAVIAGVALIVVAIIYWVEPAKSLPFPDFLGHQAGSDAVHVKHGIAAFLLGVACFVFAWFRSGPKRDRASVGAPQ